jgi:hypothetical protein
VAGVEVAAEVGVAEAVAREAAEWAVVVVQPEAGWPALAEWGRPAVCNL